jgi:sugar transferase (PEP-CTERM/EpsH1 system associated)
MTRPALSPTVCQVLHSLDVGGAEVLAARIARRLRHRYRFHFVCLDRLGVLGQELREEGFGVETLERKPGLDWRCFWRLSQALRRARADVIHAHQYTPFFYSLVARLLSRRPAVLFTEHGRHQPDYPRRKRILANRLLLQRRDRVVAVGEAVRQALIVNEGIPAPRIQVVYNGVDFEQFAHRPAERDCVRRELGLADDELVVIQVARLDYLKDHQTAIRTLGRVCRSLPRVRLVLVGEGPEMPRIEAQIQEKGLAGRVLFVGLRKDVPRLLQAADLFLLTSTSEGIPLTVIEAMATGLPVVSTRVGGLPEMLEDGESGFLAPAGDDAGLASAILRLSGDPDFRKRVGQRGRERALASFSEANMVERYRALYQGMLPG